MSSELRSRLLSRLDNSADVTPNQILQFIKPSKEGEAIEDAFRQFHDEIHEEFVSNNGNLKTDKLKKFRKQIVTLLEQYSFSDVIKITADCIESDGRINKHRFEELLNNSFDD